MDNVMVIAVITPDEAMKELDRDLEKTCEIMGLLYHNYGIELSDDEFDKVFDIIQGYVTAYKGADETDP